MARPNNKAILPGFVWDPDRPLQRAKREGAPASQALNDYALQGSTRSFDKLQAMYLEMNLKWQEYLKEPGAWIARGHQPPPEPPSIDKPQIVRWSYRFAWGERVERYDEIRKRLDQLEFDAQRVALKKKRIEVLEATLTRLQAALLQLKADDASWGEVTAGITKISEALRIEMGDAGAGGGGMPRARITTVVVNMPPGAVSLPAAVTEVVEGSMTDAESENEKTP